MKTNANGSWRDSLDFFLPKCLEFGATAELGLVDWVGSFNGCVTVDLNWFF